MHQTLQKILRAAELQADGAFLLLAHLPHRLPSKWRQDSLNLHQKGLAARTHCGADSVPPDLLADLRGNYFNMSLEMKNYKHET